MVLPGSLLIAHVSPLTAETLRKSSGRRNARRKAGPLFRKVSTRGSIGGTALHPDAVRRILLHRLAMAGLTPEEVGQGFDRLSAHALRVGFITEAYAKGVRDEDIMRHTRHRDLRTMRGYVRRAGLVTESPAGMLDL